MTLACDVLGDDLWGLLAPRLRLADTGAVARTCRAWRRAISLPHVDRAIAQSYIRRAVGDTSAWRAAHRCPYERDRVHVCSYRVELRRIETLKRAAGPSRLASCELYPLCEMLADSGA